MRRARFGRRASTAPCEAPRVGHGAIDQHAEVVVGQRLEREQQRTREQRRDHRERRVLGRRRDEDDPAVLDSGQQRVLLRLREAVDLVEEQHGSESVQVALASASSMTSRTSRTPAVTADSSTNLRPEPWRSPGRASSCRCRADPTG